MDPLRHARTNVNISISIFTDHPPDRTVPLDYITSAVVSFAVIFFMYTILYVIVHRKDQLIKLRAPLTICLFCIGGSFHIIGAFLGNGFLNKWYYMENIRNAWCPLWEFWIKFALGLNLWFCGYMIYMIRWTFTVNVPLMSEKTRELFAKIPIIFHPAIHLIVLSIPIVLICTIASATRGIVFDEEFKWCMTRLADKILLISWIFAFSGVLITLCVYHVVKKSRGFVHLKAVWGSLITGMALLMVMIVINYYSIETTWWGRSLSIYLLIVFYVFAVVRFFMIDMIIRTLDSSHALVSLTEYEEHILNRMKLENIMENTKLKSHFIEYMNMLPAVEGMTAMRIPGTWNVLDPELNNALTTDYVPQYCPMPVLEHLRADNDEFFYVAIAPFMQMMLDFESLVQMGALPGNTGFENVALADMQMDFVKKYFIAWDEVPEPGDTKWRLEDASSVFKRLGAQVSLAKVRSIANMLATGEILKKFSRKWHAIPIKLDIINAMYVYTSARAPIPPKTMEAIQTEIMLVMALFFAHYMKDKRNEAFVREYIRDNMAVTSGVSFASTESIEELDRDIENVCDPGKGKFVIVDNCDDINNNGSDDDDFL